MGNYCFTGFQKTKLFWLGLMNIDSITCGSGGGNTDCLNKIYWLSDGSPYDTAMTNSSVLTPTPYDVVLDSGGPCLVFNNNSKKIDDETSTQCAGGSEYTPVCEFDCLKEGI